MRHGDLRTLDSWRGDFEETGGKLTFGINKWLPQLRLPFQIGTLPFLHPLTVVGMVLGFRLFGSIQFSRGLQRRCVSCFHTKYRS